MMRCGDALRHHKTCTMQLPLCQPFRFVHEIWRDNINVKAIYLDVPLNWFVAMTKRRACGGEAVSMTAHEDKIYLLIGGYSTHTLLATMPFVIQR
jgi:hypothetical protein